jgi:hypothetical protein
LPYGRVLSNVFCGIGGWPLALGLGLVLRRVYVEKEIFGVWGKFKFWGGWRSAEGLVGGRGFLEAGVWPHSFESYQVFIWGIFGLELTPVLAAVLDIRNLGFAEYYWGFVFAHI